MWSINGSVLMIEVHWNARAEGYEVHPLLYEVQETKTKKVQVMSCNKFGIK